jgi:RhtB (resistance to homoserine/threonine) family protein
VIPVQLVPFLAVVGVITITPGPDTTLVVRNTLHDGRRHGLLTALGCSTGLLIWGMASSVGLATVFRASSSLFFVVRVAGGIYLVWLGLRMMWSSWRVNGVWQLAVGISPNRRDGRQPFLEGLLTDLLNPKAAAFFTALLPQFVTPRDPVLITTLLFATIAAVAAFAGLCAYVCVASRARVVLGQPSIRRLFDRVTGAVLLGLGVRMLAREAR